jgi:hypothetical protein
MSGRDGRLRGRVTRAYVLGDRPAHEFEDVLI